jgi:hypothetical protein
MVTENLKHFKRITGRITLKLLILDWTQRLNALSIRPNAVQPPQSFNRGWEQIQFSFLYMRPNPQAKRSQV